VASGSRVEGDRPLASGDADARVSSCPMSRPARRASTRLSSTVKEGFRNAARLGHVAMGVVYVLVGFIAFVAAFNHRLQPTGAEGALYQLLASPIGVVAVVAIAIGLVADAVWQGVRALFDSDEVGDGLSGLSERMAAGITGVLHLGLALGAMRLLVAGSPPLSDAAAGGWLARVLSFQSGIWIVGLAGVITMAIAVIMFYRTVAPELVARLNLQHTRGLLRTWTVLLARLGFLARGAVYSVIAGFLLLSVLHEDRREVPTMGGALRAVRYERHGTPLLAAIALGFVANGTVELIRARHRTVKI
jgi:hypothetical protein